MAELEQHHIRYEEIHGEDEIILLSHEEHMKVHREDRANGFKPIPEWIVQAAHARSPMRQFSLAQYAQSKDGKATLARYQQTEKGKIAQARYDAKHNQTEEGKATNRTASAKYYAKIKAKRDE